VGVVAELQVGKGGDFQVPHRLWLINQSFAWPVCLTIELDKHFETLDKHMDSFLVKTLKNSSLLA